MPEAPEDRLDPHQRHLLGRVYAAAGWIGQLGSVAFVVLAAPVLSAEIAAGAVLHVGAMGVVLAPIGEMLQWDARRELEVSGEVVPEAWQPEEGNRLDRAIVAVMFYPIGERLAAVWRNGEVPASVGLVASSIASLLIVGILSGVSP